MPREREPKPSHIRRLRFVLTEAYLHLCPEDHKRLFADLSTEDAMFLAANLIIPSDPDIADKEVI